MSFSPAALAHLLFALTALIVAAHLGGYLFRRLGQPQVIGEILGGLALGPTLLGGLFPGWFEASFTGQAQTWTVLGAVYQLGLLLLMFCSGLEMRTSFERGERRLAGALTISGIGVPLALVAVLHPYIDLTRYLGPAQHEGAFVVVVAIGVAVTSIPVISRILLDLGVLGSPFARLVLAAAVVEDVILYVLLAIALSLAGSAHGEAFGLPVLLGLTEAGAASLAYHVLVTGAFFVLALWGGPLLVRATARSRLGRENNPVALLLLLLFATTGLAVFLGIAPMLGAFAAGLAANRAGRDASGAREAIKRFSFAFLIPVYFAMVGLRLDLVREFDPLFFLAFLGFACAVKLVSTYAGARLAGEPRWGSWNLAVAMNARGGPGIVLASVAFDAGIIDASFYATLVMLAIVTSCMAGSWLAAVLRRGYPLR